MTNENEELWKKYREEMSVLLHRLDYKEVWGWVDDKTSDEATKGLPDIDTLRNAERFLEDLMCAHYVHIPDMYFDDGCVVYVWNPSSETRLEVQFRPNNEWNILFEKSTVQGYGPEPSFWMEATDKHPREPHFFLEDHLTKEIERPQQWSQDYQPMVRPKRIMWCTGYWDGPLAGYCTESVGNDMYYFECVEEQNYSPRSRMYAVYELSPGEQIDACFAHAKWIGVLKSSWRWWLYLFSFRLFRMWRLATSEKRQEAWREKHKLLGYFIG